MENRTLALTSSCVPIFLLALSGCASVGELFPGSQMSEISSQVGDAKQASVPDKTRFPEGESLLRAPAKAFGAKRSESFLRGAFTASEWEARGALQRSAPVVIFTERAEKGVVEGSAGEGRVCFQFNCSLVQRREPSEDFQGAELECNETEFQKVTCKSVSRI